MIEIIEALQGGERCVCDLQASLDLGQSLLSHHLRALREAGLVHTRREGRWVHYALSDELFRTVEAWLSETRAKADAAKPRGSRC